MNKYVPFVASVLCIGVILYFVFLIFKPFFSLLFIAFTITIFVSPVFSYLHQYQKMNKIFAASLTLFLFTLLILLPLTLLGTLLFQEIRHMVQYIQINHLNIDIIQNMVNGLFRSYGISPIQLNFDIKEYLGTFISFLTQHSASFFTTAGTILGNSLFTLFISFYLLLEKDNLVKFFLSINPLHTKHANDLLDRSIQIINRTVKGNLILMLLQTLVGMLGLSIFGSIAPILLGLLYGIFSIIPTLGAFLIWIPVAIYLFFTHNVFFAIGFIIWCIGTSYVIEEYITPRLLNDQTQIHPLLIVIAVLGAIEQFGLIGMLLGPVIISLSFAALQIYKEIVLTRKINE